ncbi:MAG: hypothetical protein AAFR87_31320, partial [Bacteroidota bacterium]
MFRILSVSIFLLLLQSSGVFAQWDKIGQVEATFHVVKNIPRANQIEVDAEGNIFLLDSREGFLYKYLKSAKYDSTVVVGGISTRDDGFLHPKKLAVKNRQDFYLLDDLGRKIVLLDKELKVVESSDFYAISSSSTIDIPDEFEPYSFDISSAGETFVLNKFNNRIYKINAFGKIESAFGGLDYGRGSLYEPEDVQLSPQNRVYIGDVENQRISVFDMFGVYLKDEELTEDLKWERFHIHESLLILWNESQLLLINSLSREKKQYKISEQFKLRDLYIG